MTKFELVICLCSGKQYILNLQETEKLLLSISNKHNYHEEILNKYK